jgi:heavy metal sensor kinase
VFRFKIVLLSVLLSGIVLGAFGAFSISLMEQVGMDRIDREILSLGEGHLAVGPPKEYWQNFENSLHLIYRGARAESLIVLIKDPGGEVLFRSANWPGEITEAAFPQFDRAMDPRPRPGGERDLLPADERRGDRLEPSTAGSDVRGSPPLEAYRACEGKSAGSRSQFSDSRGETLSGTCEQDEEGRLVLRPDRNRRDREQQASDARPDRARSATRQLERADPPSPVIKRHFFSTLDTPAGVFRTGIMGSERITMMIGVNLADYYADAKRYRRAFLTTVPVALLLLALGGWVIAERALRPVALITRTAESITARALDQRVPLVSGDRELTRLVKVINGMLYRLETSFGQAVRFSADAAHELQTPLAILQGELDAAVQQAPDGSEEQQRASNLLEEVQRLKAIVQKLLVLARADAGRLSLRLKPVDLSAMIRSAAEDAAALAPHLTIEKAIAPDIMVDADAELLGQAVSNLMTNAVKYNREHGVIRFLLSVRNNKALFTIANTGAPIPLADRERIFDRFFRVDRSRSGEVSGSGLGLSLAREIVHAHRGELRLDPPKPDGLVSFTLSLPSTGA